MIPVFSWFESKGKLKAELQPLNASIQHKFSTVGKVAEKKKMEIRKRKGLIHASHPVFTQKMHKPALHKLF